MSDTGPEVVAGAVVAYRLYDVAYAIDLAKVEAVWARRVGRAAAAAGSPPRRPRRSRSGRRRWRLALEPRTIQLEAGRSRQR